MKNNLPMPSIDLLRERYEVVGDSLVWKTVSKHGDRKIGSPVGTITNTGNGKCYRYCGVTVATGKYVRYLVHRIAYAVAYGVDPGEFQVDHIDGNTLNNSAENLRLATAQQNMRNQNFRTRPTKTGVRGVHLADSKSKPYAVHLKVENKMLCFGSFATLEEASIAAKQARERIYGQFAGADVFRSTDQRSGYLSQGVTRT